MDEVPARIGVGEAAERIGADDEAEAPVLLSLFDGTGSICKPFAAAGWTVRRLDIDGTHGADIVADILDWQPEVSWSGRWPDVIFAGPECKNYSVARTRAKKPRDLRLADSLVAKMLEIIDYFHAKNPRLHFFVENPDSSWMWKRWISAPLYADVNNHFLSQMSKLAAADAAKSLKMKRGQDRDGDGEPAGKKMKEDRDGDSDGEPAGKKIKEEDGGVSPTDSEATETEEDEMDYSSTASYKSPETKVETKTEEKIAAATEALKNTRKDKLDRRHAAKASLADDNVVVLDYCQYGSLYRKRTRIMTNSLFKGLLCDRSTCKSVKNGRHLQTAQRGSGTSANGQRMKDDTVALDTLHAYPDRLVLAVFEWVKAGMAEPVETKRLGARFTEPPGKRRGWGRG